MLQTNAQDFAAIAASAMASGGTAFNGPHQGSAAVWTNGGWAGGAVAQPPSNGGTPIPIPQTVGFGTVRFGVELEFLVERLVAAAEVLLEFSDVRPGESAHEEDLREAARAAREGLEDITVMTGPRIRTVLCKSSPVVGTCKFSDLKSNDVASVWHDHSPDGGDPVCLGPFVLFT